jgi:hypothetical protein
MRVRSSGIPAALMQVKLMPTSALDGKSKSEIRSCAHWSYAAASLKPIASLLSEFF